MVFCICFDVWINLEYVLTMNRSDGPHHAQNNCAPTAISCLLPEHDGVMCDFLVVSPHSPLLDEDSARNPYNFFPGFRCTVVYCQSTDKIIIIKLMHLIGHLAQLVPSQPPGTFGMSRSIHILNHSHVS